MLRTWKQMQGDSAGRDAQRPFAAVFDEEIADSRRTIRSIMDAEPIITVQVQQSEILRRIPNRPVAKHEPSSSPQC